MMGFPNFIWGKTGRYTMGDLSKCSYRTFRNWSICACVGVWSNRENCLMVEKKSQVLLLMSRFPLEMISWESLCHQPSNSLVTIQQRWKAWSIDFPAWPASQWLGFVGVPRMVIATNVQLSGTVVQFLVVVVVVVVGDFTIHLQFLRSRHLRITNQLSGKKNSSQNH